MGGYSPASEEDDTDEDTIVVVGPKTLALFGRGGLTLVQEVGPKAQRWRDRRNARRRLLWGSLTLLVPVGLVLVTLWRR